MKKFSLYRKSLKKQRDFDSRIKCKTITYISIKSRLLSPVPTKTEIYNALRDVTQSSSNDNDESIEVSNCQITLVEVGVSVSNDFIQNYNKSQLDSAR